MKRIRMIGYPWPGVISLLVFVSCSVNRGKEADSPAREIGFEKLDSGFVFEDDQPFAQCHASTLIRTDDNRFLVAWFGGTREKNDDVGIWLSKGTPGAWSRPIEIAKVREDAHWNPVLFKTPSGGIILFFKVGKVIDQWETWYMVSEDNGNSWTDATVLVPGDKGGRGPVRNRPIVLSDGSWLAPASNESKGVWNAFTDRSEDNGKTWTATPFIPIDRNVIPEEGVIQPTLWESAPGSVHMLLRSSSGSICRSDSKDYGRTWSQVYKTDLPNNNSAIDLTRLSDGALVLAFNPVEDNWGARRPISVAVSSDNGLTWSRPTDIESGEEGDEFSYPSVTNYGDTVAGTYTWKRKRIAFWVGKVKNQIQPQ